MDMKKVYEKLQFDMVDQCKAEGIRVDVGYYPRAYCYVEEKIIKFNLRYLMFDATEETLVDLFHEVGHIKTNKSWMKRYEKEYYATVWAIEELKKHNINVSDYIKEGFQEYIWQWRDYAIAHRCKNVMSKEQLKLI